MSSIEKDFIAKYRDTIPYKPLIVILESFFEFSNYNDKKADDLMDYCKEEK